MGNNQAFVEAFVEAFVAVPITKPTSPTIYVARLIDRQSMSPEEATQEVMRAVNVWMYTADLSLEDGNGNS